MDPQTFRLTARPVPQAYKPLRTFIALVGMEVWSSGDQISVTPPAGASLDAFMRWRNDQLLKRKKHDNAHLIRWGNGRRLGRAATAAAVAMETGSGARPRLVSNPDASGCLPAGSTLKAPPWGWPSSARCARATLWASSR